LPLMIVTDGIINNRNNVDNLPWVYPTYRSMQVFGYISLFLPTIPLFFLLTSWIVGTNGIIKSKKYILFFWFILCVSLLCMFLTIILSSTIISNHNSFWI
jgi:hypothetical protein